MTEQEARLITEITPQQVESNATAIVDFEALRHVPSQLGYAAHVRLEELLGTPVASDDANPDVSNERTGQRTGFALGGIFGHHREFTRNLPLIKANLEGVASERNVPADEIWEEVTEILIGSGIGKAMYRTLDRPVDGGMYGARTFVEERSTDGIAVIVRENIANWGARRHEQATAFLGALSSAAMANVRLIAYAGSGRVLSGHGELWRPEMQPYVIANEQGQAVTELTEAHVGELIHAPAMQRILGKMGLNEEVTVSTVYEDNPKASGDVVMRAIAHEHGDQMRDMLIVEIGNAPAGYTQLDGALVLAEELGIDPTEQYLGVTDAVQVVRPQHFASLSTAEKSRVQNAQTGLNSLNGWLRAVSRVNQYALDRISNNR